MINPPNAVNEPTILFIGWPDAYCPFMKFQITTYIQSIQVFVLYVEPASISMRIIVGIDQ